MTVRPKDRESDHVRVADLRKNAQERLRIDLPMPVRDFSPGVALTTTQEPAALPVAADTAREQSQHREECLSQIADVRQRRPSGGSPRPSLEIGVSKQRKGRTGWIKAYLSCNIVSGWRGA